VAIVWQEPQVAKPQKKDMWVDPAQPKRGKQPVVGILGQLWPVGQNRVEPAQHENWKRWATRARSTGINPKGL